MHVKRVLSRDRARRGNVVLGGGGFGCTATHPCLPHILLHLTMTAKVQKESKVCMFVHNEMWLAFHSTVFGHVMLPQRGKKRRERAHVPTHTSFRALTVVHAHPTSHSRKEGRPHANVSPRIFSSFRPSSKNFDATNDGVRDDDRGAVKDSRGARPAQLGEDSATNPILRLTSGTYFW